LSHFRQLVNAMVQVPSRKKNKLLVLGVIPLPESMQARRAQPDARGNSTAQRLGKEAMAKVLALSAPSIS
jgi:hypothetical protein